MRVLGVRVHYVLALLSHQTQVLSVLPHRMVYQTPHCSCLATISRMPLVQVQEGEKDMKYRYPSRLTDLQAHQHYAFPFPDDSG